MTDWSDAELEAAVIAYRRMQRLEVEQRPYSKKAIYSELEVLFPRTAKAFEYRMQNISAVLHDEGLPWIPGLKPAGNIGANVRPRLLAILTRSKFLSGNVSSVAYKVKLPALRDWLIGIARAGGIVTYGEVMDAFAIDRFSLRHAMDFLGHQADNLDEPIITALIVSRATGHCSAGLAAEFGIVDDVAERAKLYDYWRNEISAITAPEATTFVSRTAKFVSVEARPEQAAFRRRVFERCNGRCVISGFDIVAILDAAHKTGRSWRNGQNSADDGYVLRKDLHALYDACLLKISEGGLVSIHKSIYAEYGQYSETMICTGTT